MASLKGLLLRSPPKGMVASLKTLCYIRHMEGTNNLQIRTCPQQEASVCWLQACLYSSRNKGKANVLTTSSMIMQDGSVIEELPILIRRVTRDTYPFTTHSYSGNIREESEFDKTFKQSLQDCLTIGDVFKLLEVPSDCVQGYSAAFALQRLHDLKHLTTDWRAIHSFIRSAVMRELYDTVQADIQRLSSKTLVSLVKCYLSAEGFSPNCVDAINAEIQSRLAESSMSIEELLTLADILKVVKTGPTVEPQQAPATSTMKIASEAKSRFLSSNIQETGRGVQYFDKFCAKSEEIKGMTRVKGTSLLEEIWIHMRSRYNDMTELTLPLTINSLTHEHRYLVKMLEKPLSNVWPQLTAEGAAQCLDSLFRLKVYSLPMLTYLGRWAYVNVHLMTPQLLLSFLNTFMHFNRLDPNIVKVIERCLHKKGMEADSAIVALCVEYCRSHNYLSPIVMDTAASHFTLHCRSYEPLQMFAVLRSFGYLNYLPKNQTHFLNKVEQTLSDQFSTMEPEHLLEVLSSFTFLAVLPYNFVNRINSDYFYTKVSDLQNPAKTTALMWVKVLKHAMFLSSSDLDKCRDWVMNRRSKWSVFCYTDRQRIAIWNLKESLTEILGLHHHHVLPFYSCCAFYLDSHGQPLRVSKNAEGKLEVHGPVNKRVAILLRSTDHFSINTGKQLLGAQAQRQRQLHQLGFITIEVHAGEFFNKSSKTRRHSLEKILSKHVDFSLVETGVPTSKPSKDRKNSHPNDFQQHSSLSETISQSKQLWSEPQPDDLSSDEESEAPMSLNVPKPQPSDT